MYVHVPYYTKIKSKCKFKIWNIMLSKISFPTVICFSILSRDLSYEAQDLIAALLQKVGLFQILHFD